MKIVGNLSCFDRISFLWFLNYFILLSNFYVLLSYLGKISQLFKKKVQDLTQLTYKIR